MENKHSYVHLDYNIRSETDRLKWNSIFLEFVENFHLNEIFFKYTGKHDFKINDF